MPELAVFKPFKGSNIGAAVSVLSDLAFCNACLSAVCDLTSICGCFDSNSD